MEKITKLAACDRCGGKGSLEQWRLTGLTCWKCGGTGKMEVTEVIRTDAEQARYDDAKARREAKKQAERDLFASKIRADFEEAERQRVKAEAERIANLHRGYIGNIGDKIAVMATALYSASYEARSFSGFGTVWMTLYAFETADRKLLIWKTAGAGIEFEKGKEYNVAGTVKDHSGYREEEQTILSRAKAIAVNSKLEQKEAAQVEPKRIETNQSNVDLERFFESIEA